MKLMIVDDAAFSIKAVEMILTGNEKLKSYNLDIVAYQRPRDALVAINNEAPDILILDLRMPDMTGMELLDAINYGPNSGLEVIILTAYPSEAIIIEAAKRGIDFFIPKPFKVMELVRAVKTLAARRFKGGKYGGV